LIPIRDATDSHGTDAPVLDTYELRIRIIRPCLGLDFIEDAVRASTRAQDQTHVDLHLTLRLEHQQAFPIINRVPAEGHVHLRQNRSCGHAGESPGLIHSNHVRNQSNTPVPKVGIDRVTDPIRRHLHAESKIRDARRKSARLQLRSG